MGKKTLQDLVADEPSGVHGRMEALRARQGWLPKAVAISVAIMNRLEEKKWSQAELARAMGVTPQYISRIVKAEENLSLETISKLESALGYELVNVSSPKIQSQTTISRNYTILESSRIYTAIIDETASYTANDPFEPASFQIEPSAA
jgi:transcriptional regulator with XRE-family HTH domain